MIVFPFREIKFLKKTHLGLFKKNKLNPEIRIAHRRYTAPKV
jgi:hypothetical protein